MTESKVFDHFTAKTGLERRQVRAFFDELHRFADREGRSNREVTLPGFGTLVKAKIIEKGSPDYRVIVRRGRPKKTSTADAKLRYVVVSVRDAAPRDHAAQSIDDHYAKSMNAPSRKLAALESRFDDLLASMQTPKSKRAMKEAFNASPTQLRRAAVKRASKKR